MEWIECDLDWYGGLFYDERWGRNDMKTYKRPNGKETQDVDRYIDAWEVVAIPVCDMLNVQLCGFDPDFLFSCGDMTVSLPVWFVERIGRVVEENKRLGDAIKDWAEHVRIGQPFAQALLEIAEENCDE